MTAVPSRPTPLVTAWAGLFLGTWATGAALVESDALAPLRWLDSYVATEMAAHRPAWLTDLADVWTDLGSGPVLVPLIVLAGLALGRRPRAGLHPLLLLVTVHLGALLIYEPVKRLVERPRPHVAPIVASAHGYAFPSGHSAQAVAVGGLLVWLVLERVQDDRTRRVVVAVGVTLIAGIVASRVVLGVHWTTDVVAGGLLGGLWSRALVVADGQRALTRKSATSTR